jgi:hypothetical protein
VSDCVTALYYNDRVGRRDREPKFRFDAIELSMAVDRVRQNNSGGLTLATVTGAQLAIDREPTR